MKKIFFLWWFIAVLPMSYAADITVSSPSAVPSGYTLATSGYYEKGGSPDRYRVSSTSSSSSSSSSVDAADNILGQDSADLRSGNVDMNTIPNIIVSIIKTLLSIAGTVAIFSLIYHAVQMQLKSGITGDSSGVDSAKKWMINSLIGFVIAILAWFLVTRAVELLGAIR